MKKTVLILTVLATTMMSSRCGGDTDNCHRNIRVVNNSDKTLRVFASLTYPDSISHFGGDISLVNIEPHSVYGDYSRSCYEAMIPHQNKHGVLMYFLIDNDVISKYPNDVIIKDKMYLKKYDLTVEGLQKSNWTVTYP